MKTVVACSVESSDSSHLEHKQLPRARMQAGLSNRFCPSSLLLLSVIKKNFITADLEVKTLSKQEVNDEIRNILACVYLVKHRAVSFSAFSTFV